MTVALENLGSLITYKDAGHDQCLGYLMCFTGRGVYDASLGKVEVTPELAEIHNRLLDDALLHGLDERCEVGQHGTFYIGKTDGRNAIKTFLGLLVSADVSVNGRTLTFVRKGKVFRGKTSRQHDLFNFRRIA